jgi:hypothetical protein
MTRHTSLIALCVLAAALLPEPAAAASVVKQHQLTSTTSFCCSGSYGNYASPWVGVDGPLYTDVGYSWGSFASTAGPGSFSGAIRLQATTEYGVHVRALGGEIWNVSTDTLHAASSTLPVGTPLTLRFKLYIDGDWGASGRSLLNVAGMSQVESSSSYPGLRQAQIDVQNLLQVGGSWTFDTQYRMWGDGLTGKVIDGAGWDSFDAGNAWMTVEVLESDAFLTADSGHNYAPVPEPTTWALMLGGLAFIARRRLARAA